MFSESQENITFDEVRAFARQGNPETAQLVYCASVEDPELPRYITALANTFGGHIIIGISPYAKTRKPRTFTGVLSFDKSYLESIIASINPYPRHTIRITTSNKGAVFVIIHIPEGLYGPYRDMSEPHSIWILNGDPKGLSRATATDILRISSKSKSSESQAHVLRREKQIFSSLCEEEKEKSQIDQRISVYEPEFFEKIPYVTCSIYPRDVGVGDPYTRPKKLDTWLSTVRVPGADIYLQHFPAPDRQPIPDGVGTLCGDDTRMVYVDQFYVDGSVHHAHSLLQYLDSEPVIFLTTLLMELHDFFAVASEMYTYLGYRGVVDGVITLHNLKGMQVAPLVPLNHLSFPSSLKALPFDTYTWNITTTTHTLAAPTLQLTFEQNLMERIHWDVRASFYSEELLHLALLQAGRINIPYPYDDAPLST